MKKYGRLFVSIISSTLALGFCTSLNHTKEAVVETKATVDINDYSDCEDAHKSTSQNKASELLTALRSITSPGSSGSYDQLWETYKTAYLRDDGKIFDYYSNITNFRPGTDQAGNYSGEGDVYNREHSIPKSWWGGSTTNQGADPYIVVPTDGWVNSMRSNYAMGPVGSVSKHSENNFSKLGTCVSGWGNNGATVFEPDDSVKGDFARIIYYAIAKYSASYGWTSGDGSSVFSGSASTNFGLTNYAIKYCSAWSALDPVSDWERSVNDKVAATQGNRNPFIDHPEYANTLWGSNSNYTTYPEETKTLSSISLSNKQTSFEVGDSFVKPTVTAHYDDNSTRDVTSSATFSGYNLSSVGNYTVTASYTEGGVTKTATYSISVTASTKTLSSIAVSNPKTDFKVGNSFSFGGTVTATFSNSSQLDVTDQAEFSGYNLSQKGNQTVTVSYTFQGTTKTAQYSISVAEASNEITIEVSDIPEVYATTSFTASGYSFGCLNIGNSYTSANGNMQWRNNQGYLYNTTPISNIESITINEPTSGDFTGTIYVGSTEHPTSGTSYSINDGDTVDIDGSPSYFTIQVGTVSGGGKTGSIVIACGSGSITPEPITSISAEVKNDKTFYVGETITSSDITVKDSNNQTLTNFDFDDYQFKYSDSTSGGALSKKYLVVDYEDFSCNVGVNVQRKAYATPTGGSTLEHTGAEFKTAGIASGTSSSYEENQTATVDGVTFNVSGYVYDNTYLSFSTSKSNAPGSVVSTTPYPSGITNVTVNGATPDIQLSTDGDTWVDFANATTSTTNYCYLKVYFKNTSQSSYINISSISVTLKASETAENVSNYIMYEDTNNQCVSKLSIAMTYFGNLTSSGKSTFASSDDYVIKSARERLEAWAANQGKIIDYSTGELTNKAGVVQYGVGQENSSTTIIFIVSAMSVVSLSVLLIIKKKRLHN